MAGAASRAATTAAVDDAVHTPSTLTTWEATAWSKVAVAMREVFAVDLERNAAAKTALGAIEEAVIKKNAFAAVKAAAVLMNVISESQADTATEQNTVAKLEVRAWSEVAAVVEEVPTNLLVGNTNAKAAIW